MFAFRLTFDSSVTRFALTFVPMFNDLLELSPLALPLTLRRKLHRFHGSRDGVDGDVVAPAAGCNMTRRRSEPGPPSTYGTSPSDITRTIPRRTSSSEAATTKDSFKT